MPRKGPPTTMEMGFDMKLPILASERPGPSHMGILGPFPIVKSGEREITERPRSKIVRLSNSRTLRCLALGQMVRAINHSAFLPVQLTEFTDKLGLWLRATNERPIPSLRAGLPWWHLFTAV